MFNFFRSNRAIKGGGFAGLVSDMHSHVLPGIDDGAQNLAESVTLVKRMKDMGFRKIIATPHIMADYYRNTADTIRAALDTLREELIRLDIDVPVEAAAEYYLDEFFVGKIGRGELLTMGDKYLLFELPYINYPSNLYEVIRSIQDAGCKPILAHPERYPYMGGSIENFIRVREAGCYLQLNTISLGGYYGKATQDVAEELVDNDLVDFIGSDMHNVKYASALRDTLSLQYVQKLLSGNRLRNSLL